MPTTLRSASHRPQDVVAALLPLWPGTTVKRLPVAGIQSVARLLPSPRGRCGIYVLSFTDGEYYVGRTVNFAARFAGHRNKYDDIAEVLFWRMPKSAINAAEKAAIWCLEDAEFLLRNNIDVVELLGPTAFDDIVTPLERTRWLASPPSIDTGVEGRLDRPDQRRRNRTNLARLVADPRFADLVPGLRRYAAPFRSLAALS